MTKNGSSDSSPVKLLPGLWPRRIKSYVLRAGRTTLGQQRAIEELGPKYVLPFQLNIVNWEQIFSHRDSALRILEIGFGMGETTAYIAKIRPQDDFLAIEVHEPGVGALLKRIGEDGISNIRIIRHDAVEVLEHMIADASLDGVHLYFPDPWHKKKHHKRRLVQDEWVEKLRYKLKTGAYIHMATDWQEYAQQMLAILSKQAWLENSATSRGGSSSIEDGYSVRPDYRPVTKFENRGLQLGHGVWDLIFRKR
jgi:tRNA (guanine-N7-)-methyltransferase